MAYATDNLLISDSNFQVRVKLAVRKAATQILGEAASGNAARDTKRWNLARAALMGHAVNGVDHTPESVYDAFLKTCASLSTTNGDTEVDTQVSSIWDDMAGGDSSDT